MDGGERGCKQIGQDIIGQREVIGSRTRAARVGVVHAPAVDVRKNSTGALCDGLHQHFYLLLHDGVHGLALLHQVVAADASV